MMTQARFNDENMILSHYLGPKAFAFSGLNTFQPVLKAVVKTNNGKVYVLHYNLSNFPAAKPSVYVTQMLYTKNGARGLHPRADQVFYSRSTVSLLKT